jgi:hypothetical protein
MKKTLNLQLKNLKFHEDISEETPCFSADVHEDGKLIAYVKNSGFGGGNEVRAAEGISNEEVAHLWDMDVECDIMQMAEDLHFLRKNQGTKFVLKKDGNEYTNKAPKSFAQLKKAPNYKEWIARQIAFFEGKGYTVLNTNL